jgi:hypothetical protein
MSRNILQKYFQGLYAHLWKFAIIENLACFELVTKNQFEICELTVFILSKELIFTFQ